MSLFTGAGVAIVTPMHEDGSVNYEKLQQLIDFQVEGGTDSIIICGTTGESATLSEQEHIDVIRAAVEFTGHRIPVIAGTGSNSTDTAIYLTKEAEKAGADGALVVTPYYNKATQKGLIRHYTEIAKNTSLPIIMYNVPSRTGCNILPATAVWLCKNVENIVAIKDATGNISQTIEMMSMADGCIDLYSGNDDQVLPILSCGGLGVISVLSNIAPQETHDMCRKFFDGDIAGSREIQYKAIKLINALFMEVNPIPVKTALKYIGIDAGPMRMPLTEMEPEHAEILKKEMEAFGLLK